MVFVIVILRIVLKIYVKNCLLIIISLFWVIICFFFLCGVIFVKKVGIIVEVFLIVSLSKKWKIVRIEILGVNVVLSDVRKNKKERLRIILWWL